MRRDVPSPGLARSLYAGLARAADLLACLAFWATVAFPALYVAVHLQYGLADLSTAALAALVGANALAVAAGHRHNRADADTGDGDDRREGEPTDAPAVAPVGGD